MPCKVTIVARGEYPGVMSESLRSTLCEAIAQHLRGYGLKDVQIDIHNQAPADSAASPERRENPRP